MTPAGVPGEEVKNDSGSDNIAKAASGHETAEEALNGEGGSSDNLKENNKDTVSKKSKSGRLIKKKKASTKSK
jgi:hypothetical protein